MEHRSNHQCLFYFIPGGKKGKEDTFGMNDEDWDVYKEIVG